VEGKVKRLGDMQEDFGGKGLYVGHDCSSYHTHNQPAPGVRHTFPSSKAWESLLSY
jgi:hypothetical protein